MPQRRGGSRQCADRTSVPTNGPRSCGSRGERARPTDSKATPPAKPEGRKPWKKKTPVQILLDQVEKLREEIQADEQELEEKKQQLKKFEEASKLFEKK